MTTSSKLIGGSTYFFVLCVGLSAYAHPRPLKGGQEEKIDETKLKENKKSDKQEFDKNNAKGQQEMGDKSKVPLRTLQNN
jgi:hypothetical protein